MSQKLQLHYLSGSHKFWEQVCMRKGSGNVPGCNYQGQMMSIGSGKLSGCLSTDSTCPKPLLGWLGIVGNIDLCSLPHTQTVNI